MKSVALFFGSFNPMHIGHLILANHILQFSLADELWLVITPHNPLKNQNSLLPDYNRLEMVNLALTNYPEIKACDIEFALPKPSYTIDSLAYLKAKYPNTKFSIIMGEDNLHSLPKWKNYQKLINDHPILVYPRVGDFEKNTPIEHPNIHKIEAPMIELSATLIRQMIKQGQNVRPLLPPEVFDYLDRSDFYR
jgi:nicotinate-nucleotide adenylyltransferase